MHPMVKKAGAALAVKEIVDRVQEARKPKPSLLARMGPKFLVVGLIGATAYLVKSGKLSALTSRRAAPQELEPAAYPTGPTVDVREASDDLREPALHGSSS